jgi:hypothetical protein
MFEYTTICLFFYMSVLLSVCSSICLFFYLSVLLSVCSSICLFFYLSVLLSVCSFICLFFYLSVLLSVCSSICLFFYLSVLLSVCSMFYSLPHKCLNVQLKGAQIFYQYAAELVLQLCYQFYVLCQCFYWCFDAL